ncbi:MAG: serine hydrolase [Euzebya sp.]
MTTVARRRGIVGLVLVVALILSACTFSTPESSPSSAQASSASAGSGPAATQDPQTNALNPTRTDSTTPNPTLCPQLAFVLELFNGAPLTPARFESTFGPSFRNVVGYEAFTASLEELQILAPYTLGAERSCDGSQLAVSVTAADGTDVVVTLTVDEAGLISGLLATPGDPPALDQPVRSIDDAVMRLGQLGTTRFAAFTVEEDRCTIDTAVRADEQAPIGSISTLYVLAAVISAIDAGDLSWTDRLRLEEDLVSLPSGILQDREPGSVVSVAEAAELMITISDNTAADLLLDAVGRDSVETAQASWGHSAPQQNTPFPTTREMFLLKAANPQVQQTWIQGDEATRREVLADLRSDDLPPLTLFAQGPILPRAIEWFASPADLCRILARLHLRLDQQGMGPLRQILTGSVGVPDDQQLWEDILFKGGSEPGLVAGAFLVTDADGHVYALATSVVNTEQEIDGIRAVLLIGAARDLLPAGGDQ